MIDLDNLRRLRERLRAQAAGHAVLPVLTVGAKAAAVTSQQALGKGLPGPLDVVVTPNEMNDLHGTGFLVKRVFAGWRDVLSLRIRNDYGGVHDFGGESCCLEVGDAHRPEVYAMALAALRGRPVRAVYSIPYTSADLMLAMAVSDVARAPLCVWVMDDQCVAAPHIPRPLMREFLEKCRLRLATHTELRDAYEAAFGLPFAVLPAVVPDRLVLSGSGQAAVPESSRGALLGSVWGRPSLDRLVQLLKQAGETLDWYGNHRAPGLRLDEASLAAMPFVPHGLLPEPALATALGRHPFAVVPAGELDGPAAEFRAIAALSLPGRILFAAATVQTPILVLGSRETPAAAFVLHHGIGRVAPYEAAAFRATADELRDPAAQVSLRARARGLAKSLSDAGVGDWLRGSLEDGQPRDDRFEQLFPRHTTATREVL